MRSGSKSGSSSEAGALSAIPRMPEQGRLLRRGERARVPGGVAEVGAEVHSGEHDVDVLPLEDPERDAVGRGAVDPEGLDPVEDPRATRADGAGRGDCVAGRGLLDVRGDDADVAEAARDLRQRRDAGAVDAVVVDDQDPHGRFSFPSIQEVFPVCRALAQL